MFNVMTSDFFTGFTIEEQRELYFLKQRLTEGVFWNEMFVQAQSWNYGVINYHFL